MNLTKLFEMQQELDGRIEREHPREEGRDRLAEKILALQVELGECANEWRGFKFWSKDQKARYYVETGICVCCAGTGNAFHDDNETEYEDCSVCQGVGEEFTFPLLEEYVDCLHFVMSIGLEIGFPYKNLTRVMNWNTYKGRGIIDKFLFVNKKIINLYQDIRDEDSANATIYWLHLFESFIGLGQMLGFTGDQVEEAYFEKNKVNHQRQENGY